MYTNRRRQATMYIGPAGHGDERGGRVGQTVGDHPPPVVFAPSLDDLYRSHYPQMARLAGLLVGNFQAGEEIAQDAFARLIERWQQVDNLRAYLRTTVVNLSRSCIRRRMIIRRYPPQLETLVPGPEESVVTLLAQEPILAAVGRLPRRQREAVVLRYYEGMSDAEVARALGISAGAAKSHLRRATAALSKDLETLR